MINQLYAEMPFLNHPIGRIDVEIHVQGAALTLLYPINCKLDTGSDFTTINHKSLLKIGYTKEFLQNCSYCSETVTTVTEHQRLRLQYIENIIVLLDCVELRNQRIYFSMDIPLRNLLGLDLLKHFNMDVDREQSRVSLSVTKSLTERIEAGLERDISFLEQHTID